MKHSAVIIGVGDRGSVYTMACIKAGVDVAAIYDIDEKRYAKFKERFGDRIDPRIAPSLEDALDSGADIAVIATPAYFHCDYAEKAMARGLHVLSEKPFDLDFAKVAALGGVIEKTGRSFAVGHQYHNFRNIRSIKRLFEQGRIGRPAVLRFTDERERRPKIAMHDAERGNCGPIMDMSCHYIDIMRWCFGSRPARVTARIMTYAKGDPLYKDFARQAPDTGVIYVEFESGDVGVITLCWGFERGIRAYSPTDGFGPGGMIDCFELWKRDEAITFSDAKGTHLVELEASDDGEVAFPEQTTLEALIAQIDGTGRVQVSYEDAMIVSAASFAALKSSKLGRAVAIDEILKEKPKTTDYTD